jgi:hypothetical protein
VVPIKLLSDIGGALTAPAWFGVGVLGAIVILLVYAEVVALSTNNEKRANRACQLFSALLAFLDRRRK